MPLTDPFPHLDALATLFGELSTDVTITLNDCLNLLPELLSCERRVFV